MAPVSRSDQYPPKSAYDETVVIKVRGANGKSFTMHKGTLCFYSGYFASALTDSTWLEGKSGVVELDTEEVTTFENFQYWVYTGRFGDAEEDDAKVLDWADIIKLWVFGDRRNIPRLQNETINLLRRKITKSWTVPIDQLDYLYANTTPTAGLRRFVAEAVGRTASYALLEDDEEHWPKEALVDVLKVVWKLDAPRWSREQLNKVDMCNYHVHEEGVKCSA